MLVATDIAARGIDVSELSLVVNYDLPNVPETYIHRIGRTGSANAGGMAYAFCDTEERAYLSDIQKLIRQDITVVKEHPYPYENQNNTVNSMINNQKPEQQLIKKNNTNYKKHYRPRIQR